MAGRIRSIKPELREHKGFASLSDGAARLFVMLYTLADDTGTCPADPGFIAGAVFFRRPKPLPTIGRLLSEIETTGLIERYEVACAPFLKIVGWSEKGTVTHQRIEKSQGPRYPQPESNHSGNRSGKTVVDSGNHSGTDQDLRPRTSDLRSIPEVTGGQPLPTKPDPEAFTAAERARSARTEINHEAWSHAADEHRRLRNSGIDASAILWPAVPCGAAQDELGKRTVELFGRHDDPAVVRAVHRRRVEVAVADAERERHLRWFTPRQFYDEERFWRAAELSPEQAARRAGPVAAPATRMRARDDDAPRLSAADRESIPERYRGGQS